MAFVSTFFGLIAALLIWVSLYTLATELQVDALAPYLEALSPVGEGLFAILAVISSWLIYRLLKRRVDHGSSDGGSD